MKTFGCQSMYAPIRRMVLKSPREAFIDQDNLKAQWQRLLYLSCPDYANAISEYEKFTDLLEKFDFEIIYAPADEMTSLDSIYIHDPFIISERGAILCNMGKLQRALEPEAAQKYLHSIGVPVIGRISGKGKLEGGDVLWMEERVLAVGQGFRSNAAGLGQLRDLLGDSVDELVPVQLPYWTGPQDCLHLLSFISIVDRDLAVVYSRLMPVPFRELLLEKGFQFIEVPDEEYDSLGCNVLAVGPRKCVMLNGNPVTRQRLEQAGAQVWVFGGKDISLKGTGGPTCLTRPILRGS